MTYFEYSVSHGFGTLIEHGVDCLEHPAVPALSIDSFVTYGGSVHESIMQITPERYSEFISIHGGERAI